MIKLRQKSKIICLTIFVFALVLAGESAWGQAGPRQKVKVAGPITYENNLATLVAMANGYFARERIEIDFVLGSGGTLRVAVIAKEIDFALFGFVHVPIARLKGSLFKMVLANYDQEIFSLVVRSDLKDKVKTVADLKGMKVGFSSPGASAWYMGSLYLKKAQLDPDRDVQYTSLGADPGVIYTALKTGRVDAFPTWEPTTPRVIDEGVAYPLVPIWDSAAHKVWVGPKALGYGLGTREDVIKEKPDLVKRMVAAMRDGLRYIRAHRPEEIADLVLKNSDSDEQFKGLSRSLVVKIIDRIKSGFSDGCLSRSGFEVEMNLALEYNIVPRAITFEEFSD